MNITRLKYNGIPLRLCDENPDGTFSAWLEGQLLRFRKTPCEDGSCTVQLICPDKGPLDDVLNAIVNDVTNDAVPQKKARRTRTSASKRK